MLFRNLFNDKIAQIQNLFGLFFLKTFHKKYYKTKSAATEVTAQKTQTPIVAKLTQCEMGRKRSHIYISVGISVFIKFVPIYNV